MKVTEAIQNAEKPILSLEIIPPSRGMPLNNIFAGIEQLMEFQPQFINVTNHQAHYEYFETPNGFERIRKHKKPGTVGLTAAIKHRFGIEPVPHLICGGHDKYEIEDILIDLEYLDIDNVFVVRGDPVSGQRRFQAPRDGYQYACGLVKQIAQMNQGIYTVPLERPQPSHFCIGVAGYPEKHYEAMNLESDMQHLKHKIDEGADFIITQMFFRFESFRNFVEKARSIGIQVPIIPGIKPIINERFLKLIPRSFFIDIPAEFTNAMSAARTSKQELEIGTAYVAKLTQQLLDYGVPGIHLFTMGKGRSSRLLLKRIFE